MEIYKKRKPWVGSYRAHHHNTREKQTQKNKREHALGKPLHIEDSILIFLKRSKSEPHKLQSPPHMTTAGTSQKKERKKDKKKNYCCPL